MTATVPAVEGAAGTTLLNVFVPGAAKPKGSLRHIGGGRLVEQVAGSAGWKRTVADVARYANHGREPYTGAVEVEAVVYVTRPPSAPKNRTLPVTRSSGDADKLARNILDALSAPTRSFAGAGVYRDDSQVTDLIIRKRHAGTVGPGVALTVRAVTT